MSGANGARGGIDLGGTKIQSVVVDARSQVQGAARSQTPTSGGPEAIAAEMSRCLRAAAAEAGIEPAGLAAVGVGSPGAVDAGSGTVSGARNLDDWEGSFALAAVLGADLGVPVLVGNDVDVATAAEARLGAGRGVSDLLGVFWGTGVGGGLVLGGEPWHGRGAAGEFGHMVVRKGGAPCPCGNRGCVEAYAGRAAMEARARREHDEGRKTKLFQMMKEKGKDRLTSAVWAKAFGQGDELAREVIDRAVDALGAGIASAVNLLDVELVVLGGGLGSRFGDELGERIEARMKKSLFKADRPPAFRAAELGDLGGAVGASLLVE